MLLAAIAKILFEIQVAGKMLLDEDGEQFLELAVLRGGAQLLQASECKAIELYFRYFMFQRVWSMGRGVSGFGIPLAAGWCFSGIR